jgi:hypothetical protein
VLPLCAFSYVPYVATRRFKPRASKLLKYCAPHGRQLCRASHSRERRAVGKSCPYVTIPSIISPQLKLAWRGKDCEIDAEFSILLRFR